MSARAAFSRGNTGVWQQALDGSAEALSAIAAWLAKSGLVVSGLQTIPAGNGAAHPYIDGGLCVALARLASIQAGMRPIQPAQIAVARFGDFSRIPNVIGVKWTVHKRGWARTAQCDLLGANFEAWRLIVKHGRTAVPSADEPLLAPRNGVPWAARQIRYAIAKGTGLLGGENSVAQLRA